MKQLDCTVLAARMLTATVALAAIAACAAEPPAVTVPTGVSKEMDLKSMTDAALADAAKRTGLKTEQLEVLRAEAVVWPDGSIGCPEPGVMYTQALVPGYRVLIQAGREVLHYHSGKAGVPFLCPADRAMKEVPSGSI